MEIQILNLLKTTEWKNKRKIIGIAGIPGSGKTTLAEKLTTLLPNAISLPMDGFHYTKKELSAFPNPKEAFERRGAPFTFNISSFLKYLSRLNDTTKEIYWPSFDHAKGDPEKDSIEIPISKEWLIVEGNYLILNQEYWKDVEQYFDIIIFIECDLETARKRLIKRHLESGIEPDFDSAEKRVENNDLLNAKLILGSQESKDGQERKNAAVLEAAKVTEKEIEEDDIVELALLNMHHIDSQCHNDQSSHHNNPI